MLINRLIPFAFKKDPMLTEPEYKLDEFSLKEYSDPVVPVQILMVMIGFAILLVERALPIQSNRIVYSTSLIFGSVYIVTFMFYLTEYYERLWEPYYLLPEDKLFFRFFSVLVGLVVIALMPSWPQYWSAYVIFLFILLYWKKRNTRNAYQRAVVFEFGSYSECSDPKVRSKYILVETFTLNFLILGIIALIPFSVLMALTANSASVQLGNAPSAKSFFAWGTNTALTVNIATNVLVVLVTLAFWFKKITTGLLEMKKQIEEGHYAYFEARDFRSRIRRGRHPR